MPRKTGIKKINGTGKFVALDILSLLIPSKMRGIKKRKGGHRLMTTFPFDGFI